MWFVYILTCEDETLYTGITTDLERRFNEHSSKTGAKYTKSHPVRNLAYHEKYETRSEALKREASIKRLKREQKIKLIESIMK